MASYLDNRDRTAAAQPLAEPTLVVPTPEPALDLDTDDNPDDLSADDPGEGSQDPDDTATDPVADVEPNRYLVAADDDRPSNLYRPAPPISSTDKALLRATQFQLEPLVVGEDEAFVPERPRLDTRTRQMIYFDGGEEVRMSQDMYSRATLGMLDDDGNRYVFKRAKRRKERLSERVPEGFIDKLALELHQELSFREAFCLICDEPLSDFVSEATYVKKVLGGDFVFAHIGGRTDSLPLIQWARRDAACAFLEIGTMELVIELSQLGPGVTSETMEVKLDESSVALIENVIKKCHRRHPSLVDLVDEEYVWHKFRLYIPRFFKGLSEGGVRRD